MNRESEHMFIRGLLQDYLISEDECNSDDFDFIYSRKTLGELRDELTARIERLTSTK